MDYQLSIVSYFDLLGMRQLLADARTDANKIADILQLFKTLSSPDEGSKDEWGWKFVNFSDLIVRAVPIRSDANKKFRIGLMYHEITDICHVQANLIVRGILVRGAMTVGNIVVEEGLVFGEGLARAYLQEATKSKFPRIIVDQRLMDMFRSFYLLRRHDFIEEWRYVRPYLGRDSQGVYYLNYLWYMRENEKLSKYVAFLRRHREVIMEKRRALRGDRRTKDYKSRLQKVKWLVGFHNNHIEHVTDPDWDWGEWTIDRDALMIPV